MKTKKSKKINKLIDEKSIEALNPCSARWQNALTHYKGKSFTKAQFMGLRNISQSDKLWVAFRLMSKQNVMLASAEIAESVLNIFEEKYPNDKRPRQAIEAMRAFVKGKISRANLGKARNAAAYAADAAYYAAYAARAAYAAAYAAYDATAAASYAADAAAGSEEGHKKQEKLIRKIVLKWWKD
jgi:Immunity protein Imm5